MTETHLKNASSAMPASAPTARPSTASLSSFAGSDAAAGTSTGKKVTGARADRRELLRMLRRSVPAAASGGAKLLKLAVEGLPVGADAGIAHRAFFGGSFGHILCKP